MQNTAHIPAPSDSGIFAVPQFAEEQALIDALLVDDDAAWREFNRRYSRLLLSCITRVTARFGYSTPDDVQEIYATLCLQLLSNDKRKLRSFEAGRGTRLGTWLGLLATHTAYDFLRAVRRAPKHDDLANAASLSTSGPDPAETTLLREQAQLLARALAELSDKDRLFVELFYGDGLPAEEVAARMGINVKTVYTKKHKLQARLSSLLSAGRLAA